MIFARKGFYFLNSSSESGDLFRSEFRSGLLLLLLRVLSYFGLLLGVSFSDYTSSLSFYFPLSIISAFSESEPIFSYELFVCSS